MPYSDPDNWSAFFQHPKDFILLGVGMVAGKIKSDPNWRMGAFAVALLAPTVTLVSAMDNHVDVEIQKQVAPLQAQVTNIKEDTNEIKEILRDMRKDNRVAVKSVKDDCKHAHQEIKERIQWLEHGGKASETGR